MKPNLRIFILILIISIFFISSSRAGVATSIVDVGVVDHYDGSFIYKISGNGLVSVGVLTKGGSYPYDSSEAFKYSNGVITKLGFLGSGDYSAALATSNDGSITVGYSNLSSGGLFSHAFKHDGSTMIDLGDLGGGGSFASDVSGDGSIVVGYSFNALGNGRAFKHDGSTMIDLGTLAGGSRSFAMAISRDGSVIVGDSDSSGSLLRAFKYEGSTMTDLGTLGGSTSSAYGVSADGSVIVGYSDTLGDAAFRAFKYEGSTMIDLGTLGGNNSNANDVSDDGSVIVGSSDVEVGSGIVRAFKYVDGEMIDLGTLGGEDSYAYGVSSDGLTIVGRSTTSSGDIHGFIHKTYSTYLVDINNTNTALYYNGAQLNSLMNLKSSLLKYSLTQDCNKFGANNMCLSVGYRYSNVNQNNAQEHATNLKLAYRATPNFRVGVLLDQAFSSSDPQNFQVRNSQPLMGVFANFSQSQDESGLNLKLSAAYHDTKISVTRMKLENTEAGVGDTNLKSSGLSAELSYVAKISDKLRFKPFSAIRKTSVVRDGYVENSGANFPISFETVKQNLTIATLGIRSAFDLTKSLEITFGAGLERNLKSRIDGYSGNVSEIGSFNLSSPNLRKNTKFIESGLNYKISDEQSFSGGFSYSTQVLNSAKVGMVYLSYSIGF
jgi:probable HAF family extracellular repeat protein